MWVLHLRLIIHLKLFKSPMDYFKKNLHVVITYKILVFIERPLKLHTSFFEMTLHVGIAFKVDYSPKVV